MVCRVRSLLACAAISWLLPATGCALVPKSRLTACQCYNRELTAKNQQLLSQYENLRLNNQELADKSLDAEKRLASQDQLLTGFRERVADHQQELDEVRSRYASSLDQGGGRLPRDVRDQLRQFAAQYPDFVEVDPDGNVSKFKSDVLFPTGQADLTEEGRAALHDFAAIMSGPNAQNLNITVVGHADERPIVRDATRQKYPTNWELSAHRAIAVVQYMQQMGVEPQRLGMAGYAQYQPVAAGRTQEALAKNRRVEIFVSAPDALVIGRTEAASRY
jgi:chemotaxis protein MotB